MKLKTIIEKNKDYIKSKYVCYCYFGYKTTIRVKIKELTKDQLEEKWYSSEWWIEDNELCLMKGK